MASHKLLRLLSFANCYQCRMSRQASDKVSTKGTDRLVFVKKNTCSVCVTTLPKTCWWNPCWLLICRWYMGQVRGICLFIKCLRMMPSKCHGWICNCKQTVPGQDAIPVDALASSNQNAKGKSIPGKPYTDIARAAFKGPSLITQRYDLTWPNGHSSQAGTRLLIYMYVHENLSLWNIRRTRGI